MQAQIQVLFSGKDIMPDSNVKQDPPNYKGAGNQLGSSTFCVKLFSPTDYKVQL